jgi:uncharacterized low-complexity protein
MSRRNLRKSLAALALAGALALPLAQPAAAARNPRAQPRKAPAAAVSVWGWLQILVGKQGSCVDPDGKCGQDSTRPTGTAAGDPATHRS